MSATLRALLFLACLATATAASVEAVRAEPAGAQGWPSRPVKLMVPTGAGSATDLMARLLSDGVSRSLGQPMVV